MVGAMLSLGFASCSKEGNGPSPDNSSVADTHMSVSMSLPQHNRAGDNDYNHVGEYGGIDKINDLTVYVVGDGKIDVIVVKRAAIRASMTITQQPVDGAYEIKALRPGNVEVVIATVSELKWSVAQYEKKYYLQQKDDALSPAASFVPASTDEYNGANGAMKHYDYSQLANRIDVHQLNAPYSVADVPNVPYKYVSETTHADNDYRKGNTTYILVKGKLKP
ncbi:major fimbrial subunit protein (FimA), partial [Porphyromonas sp. COT-052 OH4946]